MAEVGIDISVQKSKDLDALRNLEFDYVVTLCDNAREFCPYFPANTKVIHQGFNNPPKLAGGTIDKEDAMEHYRRVRDEIRMFVEGLTSALKEEAQ